MYFCDFRVSLELAMTTFKRPAQPERVLEKLPFLQACISVAIMSPSYQELAYGHPKKIQADVVGGNETHKAIEEDVELDIHIGKMGWRGESFLVCGKTPPVLLP